jgi:hypothetical protein
VVLVVDRPHTGVDDRHGAGGLGLRGDEPAVARERRDRAELGERRALLAEQVGQLDGAVDVGGREVQLRFGELARALDVAVSARFVRGRRGG